MQVRPSRQRDQYRPILRQHLEDLPQFHHLTPDERIAMLAISAVLPFRTNAYVIEELIDWDNIPDDPIYQLTFPQRGMLIEEDFNWITDLIKRGVPNSELNEAANDIRFRMNPHPAGQIEHNVPHYGGEPISGMQHKYWDTVLYFPSQGQTCHAYCTYCFRWAQFVGIEDLKFSSHEANLLHSYLRKHREIHELLFTGGDPMVMKTDVLRRYIEPLLEPEFGHIRHIRLGTKTLAWWPHRFINGEDADDFMRLLEDIRAAGRLPAIVAHYSHPVELSTSASREAIRRVQDAGGMIRTQAPLIRHVNDSSSVWAELWTTQTSLGCIPYYMFVERDTGAKNYFEVPLARVLRIFQKAYRSVSGHCRTVRGPIMSALPGKVLLDGVAEMNGEKVFVLKMLRGRKSEWERKPFFARYDDKATWVSELRPAFGKSKFFYEDEMQSMLRDEFRHTISKEKKRDGSEVIQGRRRFEN
jgi:L-lysine 2,3-aminomutase